MFKKTKKAFSFIIMVTLVFSLILQPLYAANIENGVDPCWNNVNQVTLNVNTSASPMYVSITILGDSGTSYTNGTIVLTKTGTTNVVVGKWQNISGSNPIFTFKENIETLTSGTYRLTITINAVKNGVTETITRYKTITY